jgi:hypothetical protein
VQSSLGTTNKDLAWWNAVVENVPNIRATVHGHDHGNEWCARDPESSIILCFNKRTGYGGYDGPGWGHGVRCVFLSGGNLGLARSSGGLMRASTDNFINVETRTVAYEPASEPVLPDDLAGCGLSRTSMILRLSLIHGARTGHDRSLLLHPCRFVVYQR